MSNKYYGEGEPTEPVPPRPPAHGQGKLILGGNNDEEARRAQRAPYQYQPQPQHVPPPQQVPHNNRPQQPYHPGPQPQQIQYGQRAGAPVQPPPGAVPNSYPSRQPGAFPNGPQAGKKGQPRRRKGCMIGCLTVVAIMLVVSIFAVTTLQRVMAFGSAISTQSPLSTQTSYMGISDRTNILVLGYGGTGHDGALLTDSLLVVSILPQSHHTSLVSVPRDLYVRVPGTPSGYGKINSVYEYASSFGKDPVAGGNAIAQKISTVTGLNVKYWMTINFNGFRELIDSIGGVDVVVQSEFTANYPKNDDPAIDAGWKQVHFTPGTHHFNGEQAIEFSRARYVIDNPREGTDFARSARQQIVVKGVLAKIKQIQTWPKFFDAMNALQKTIYTNLSLADLGLFSQKMDLNDSRTAHIGLSEANVLYSDDAFNLHPKNDDWNVISTYVKQNLYA